MYFGSSQGFELPSGDTVGPDQSFVSAERWKAMTDAPAPGEFLRVVPDLVIEILPPANASTDRSTKHAIYERNGVREYWLMDPRQKQIVVFIRRTERFDSGRTFAGATAATSEVVPGFQIGAATLFAPPSFD